MGFTAVSDTQGRDDFALLLAIACAFCYVLRQSLLPSVFSNPYIDLLAPLTILMLVLAAAYVATTGVGKINWSGLLLIVVTGISLIHCERFNFALPRWIGWVVLLIALGPINSTVRARYLRSRMLAVLNSAFVSISFLSSLWWAAGMPNLGRGDFTGVMGHSMILGPIAGYVAVLSLVRLMSRGSLLWIIPLANAWFVAMLASSRSALAAAAFGTFVIITLNLRRHILLTSAILAATTALAIAPDTSLTLVAQFLPNSMTEGLANKSWNNSREMHWNARWEEFLSSPIAGVGFASAWDGAAGVDEETGSVEPGSSYIAILSMTGCIGVAASVAFALSFIYRVLRSWHKIASSNRLCIGGLAAFWFVHLGAEGYVYAVGSLLSVTLWLWLGCLNDDLCALGRTTTRSKNTLAIGPQNVIRRVPGLPLRLRPTIRGINS